MLQNLPVEGIADQIYLADNLPFGFPAAPRDFVSFIDSVFAASAPGATGPLELARVNFEVGLLGIGTDSSFLSSSSLDQVLDLSAVPIAERSGQIQYAFLTPDPVLPDTYVVISSYTATFAIQAVTAVPEPSNLALMILGLFGVLLPAQRARRRHQAAE